MAVQKVQEMAERWVLKMAWQMHHSTNMAQQKDYCSESACLLDPMKGQQMECKRAAQSNEQKDNMTVLQMVERKICWWGDLMVVKLVVRKVGERAADWVYRRADCWAGRRVDYLEA